MAINWIQGDKFQELAEMTYAPPISSADDYCGLKNTFCEKRLKDVNLVYTHTGYVKKLFYVIKNINKEFIVLTHNSDVNVTSEYIVPPNVRKWFTTNVGVLHERISSIPIGLENDRWYQDINKKKKMLIKMQTGRGYKNLVYMNHKISTNISERTKPYDFFVKQSYCTTRMGTNGLDFADYLDNLYNHPFIVCPQGNGMDTHRFWEALYMGTIPIVKKDLNNWFYTDLPALFVDEWEQCTKSFLFNEWERIRETKFDLSMLEFDYWKDKILSCL
jgi:hypothetical protein